MYDEEEPPYVRAKFTNRGGLETEFVVSRKHVLEVMEKRNMTYDEALNSLVEEVGQRDISGGKNPGSSGERFRHIFEGWRR